MKTIVFIWDFCKVLIYNLIGCVSLLLLIDTDIKMKKEYWEIRILIDIYWGLIFTDYGNELIPIWVKGKRNNYKNTRYFPAWLKI